jgi:hypothetical protein
MMTIKMIMMIPKSKAISLGILQELFKPGDIPITNITSNQQKQYYYSNSCNQQEQNNSINQNNNN